MRVKCIGASLLILIALAVVGCAAHRPTTDSPRDARPAAQPEGPSSVDVGTPASESPDSMAEAVEPEGIGDVVAEEAGPELEADEDEPVTDDNTPLEDPVTESPLDELAEAAPELSKEELKEERDLAIAAAPTFDIPMEINDSVLAWVDVYTGRMREAFQGGMIRSGRYMDMFRRVFDEAGVPQDLIYMAAVESGFKTSAYSRAHARGIFQFISSTARRYGLRVDYWVDERSDPEKSARAAAAYMNTLYEEFGDWYLALAAYNAGEGKIRQAISRSGHRDFWGLARTRHIRRETKNHVPAILASTLISKQPAKYGFHFEPEAPLSYDTIVVEGAADLRVLARCADTDVATLKQLNPALRRSQTPPDGEIEVRVPSGAGEQALVALERIPAGERVLYARYKVRRGDTLSVIGTRHGVSIADLQQANHLGRRTVIRVGQVLRVPTSSARSYADLGTGIDEPQAEGQAVVYRVKRGDTLSNIARRHRTTARCIAAASGISMNKTLRVGERLKVVPGMTSPGAARRTIQEDLGALAANGSSSSSSKVIHTVRRGETLWRIAVRYQTSVTELCSLNELSPSSTIHPGTKLIVGYK